MKLPQLNTQEMLELENLVMNNYGIAVDQMMQQAGRSIYDFVVGELHEVKQVLIVVGRGNNGGDALVAGRLLKEKGLDIDLFIIDKHEIPILTDYDLIIDGIFGFSLKGDPRVPESGIIEQINSSRIPVLAVDVPSGLEVFSGKMMNPIIHATYTLTLGMPKMGLSEYRSVVGKVYLGNLGIPSEAYEYFGFEAPNFLNKNYLLL